MPRRLRVTVESFPIRGEFRIARGAKAAAEVVVAAVEEAGVLGRGECVPYARYGESAAAAVAALESLGDAVARGLDRDGLMGVLPAGAARNALDAALWDLEAKRLGVPAWRLAGIEEPPQPLTTTYTLSVGSPEAMAAAARAVADVHPLLKLKLAGEGDVERVAAVRAAAPDARLLVDANEAWTPQLLDRFVPALADLGVELIEQPLPAGRDAELAGYDGPIPLAADESCHGAESLDALRGLYAVVNLKLDKTGGLTEALRLRARAESAGFGVMVGCMVATSLAMAPALLLAQGARFVDLDGPLLLERDRVPGLRYDGATVHPPGPALWG